MRSKRSHHLSVLAVRSARRSHWCSIGKLSARSFCRPLKSSMSRHLFWPYLILYFLLLRGVGKVSWSITLLALFTGLAYITCFMNGVSSTSRIITIGSPLFVLVQRLHWVGGEEPERSLYEQVVLQAACN